MFNVVLWWLLLKCSGSVWWFVLWWLMFMLICWCLYGWMIVFLVLLIWFSVRCVVLCCFVCLVVSWVDLLGWVSCCGVLSRVMVGWFVLLVVCCWVMLVFFVWVVLVFLVLVWFRINLLLRLLWLW